MNKIKIKNLKKTYKKLSLFNKTENKVFENLNLDIPLNQMTVITGKNGKGKTTLFKILASYISFDEGKITVNNKNYFDYIEKNKAFLISPESRSMYYRLTVMQNLKFFTTIMNNDITETEINEILDFLEILELKNNKFYELSTGLMQRVMIARGILLSPKILLIDEPEIGLDKDITMKIFEKFQKLSENITIIYSSHRESLIKKANTIIEL